MNGTRPTIDFTLAARRLAAIILACCAMSANAVVPGEINYQGLLLDSGGSPVNGTADFVFSLYDTASAGTLLWTESHDDISVLDGVYDVVLGNTTPVTQAVVSGGALYLEIAVDGETLSPRQRLVAVPYAIRADTAESADAVGGVSSLFVSEIFEHFDWDGQVPPADDPREGVDDIDGDGLANFIDPDNDGDGFDDDDEIGSGTDMNLVTPAITGFDPSEVDETSTFTVTVQGTGFEPPLSVDFGSQTPAAQNVTATTFEVSVGPQPAGAVGVQMTNANGESGSSSFDFTANSPTILGILPAVLPAGGTTLATIQGTGFAPGISVVFGSQTPAVQNLTPTSLQVSVGPQPPGVVNVEVSYPGGASDSTTFDFFDDTLFRTVFLSSVSYDGDLGGLAGADAKCNALAAGAGLSGSFLAWLSDSAESPASRFDQGGGPFKLLDLTEVASDWADLTDATLTNPIQVDETGFLDPTNYFVWTATKPTGQKATSPDNCSEWSEASAAVSGRVGSSGATNNNWTNTGTTLVCSFMNRLYCFEQ